MSFGRGVVALPQGFRQDLTYEQILREQVRTCLECFNAGDRDGLERSLKALFALITPRIQDPDFREAIEALDDEWSQKVAIREETRRRRLREARDGAPDLVPQVDRTPDMNHLGRQMYTVLSLLERKKLGLRAEVDESV